MDSGTGHSLVSREQIFISHALKYYAENIAMSRGRKIKHARRPDSHDRFVTRLLQFVKKKKSPAPFCRQNGGRVARQTARHNSLSDRQSGNGARRAGSLAGAESRRSKVPPTGSPFPRSRSWKRRSALRSADAARRSTPTRVRAHPRVASPCVCAFGWRGRTVLDGLAAVCF